MIFQRRSRFGRQARQCVRRGIDIASSHGHAGVGSEHLLLGLADDEAGAAALHELGIDPAELRAEVLERIARRGGDPDGPDPEALASLGIDLATVRSRGHVDDRRWPDRRRRAPFTHEARAALQAAVPVAQDRRDRVVTARHVLAGLVVGRASRAADVLRHLGVSPTEVLALLR